MKCWICGSDADSGEHVIKASDLKAVFGVFTQKKPIYTHTKLRKNQPIGGIKSDKLKYGARICARCNNEKTQLLISIKLRDRKSIYLHPPALKLPHPQLFFDLHGALGAPVKRVL